MNHKCLIIYNPKAKVFVGRHNATINRLLRSQAFKIIDNPTKNIVTIPDFGHILSFKPIDEFIYLVFVEEADLPYNCIENAIKLLLNTPSCEIATINLGILTDSESRVFIDNSTRLQDVDE